MASESSQRFTPEQASVHANMTGFMQDQMQRLASAWKNGPIPDDDGTMEEIRQASVFMKMYLKGFASPFRDVEPNSPAGKAIDKTVKALEQAADDVLIIRDGYRDDRNAFKTWQASIKTFDDVPEERREALASYSRQMFEAVRGLHELDKAMNSLDISNTQSTLGAEL